MRKTKRVLSLNWTVASFLLFLMKEINHICYLLCLNNSDWPGGLPGSRPGRQLWFEYSKSNINWLRRYISYWMCWLDRKRIWNNDSTDDVKNVDLIRIHYLSWLIEIEGADGGDAPDVGPILIRHQSMWGFTEIFDQNNGEGFSRDIHPEARKAIWDFIRFMQQVDNVKNVRFSGLSKIFVF
jgi:hypothetical protein